MARIVGIKELKDCASEIIDEVLRRGHSIVVTKNNREVAQIVPVSQEPLQKLKDMGRLASTPQLKWADIELKKIKNIKSADKAIRSIISDREED